MNASLNEKIQISRQELYDVFAQTQNLRESQVLEKSQQLDKLIVEALKKEVTNNT